MSIRSMAEKLSRGIVLERRLPAEFGSAPLSVSPEAGGLRYWRPNLAAVDPGLLRLASTVQTGMGVWDIGANVGLFSFAAAFRAGPSGNVLAVEPDIDNVRLLAKSKGNVASVGGYACVEIMPCALAGPGIRAARFAIAQRARASNALAGFGNSQAGGVAETRWVPTLTLDDLLGIFPEPQILKIDVEGAEVEVLEGGARMLRDVRPVIYAEVGSERADGVQAIMRENDYLMFDAAAKEPLESESPKPSWSTIATPRGKLCDVRRWFEHGRT